MNNKKIIIFATMILLAISVCITTLTLSKKKEVNGPTPLPSESLNQSTTKAYYFLPNRIVYTHNLDEIEFSYNNETKELKEWFNKDNNFLDKFLQSLEFQTSFDDGGTTIYRDGGTKKFNYEDLTIIVCHRLDGNNNIHIGQNLEYNGNVCQLPTKEEDLKSKEQLYNNLSSELGAFITSEILIPYEVKLEDITKEKINDTDLSSIIYSKVMVNSNDEMYAIIEITDDQVIEEINKVFNEEFKNYKTAKVTDNIYAYLLHKGSDYDLNYITLTGTITKVSQNEITIKTATSEKYRVHHNYEETFKIDDKVEVIFNGFVNTSNPPQIGATSIELIK